MIVVIRFSSASRVFINQPHSPTRTGPPLAAACPSTRSAARPPRAVPNDTTKTADGDSAQLTTHYSSKYNQFDNIATDGSLPPQLPAPVIPEPSTLLLLGSGLGSRQL